ncbi:MAG: hypothetical protein MMC23_000929 [Stictis urceolatum]|nr:hypothetical protein [Stictis urceolata]
MSTKVGTEIDGVVYKSNKKILAEDEHVFRLGSYEYLFRIKWYPVVLTFTFPSKETKGGKDPLIPIRSKLEDVDIKIVIPYIIEKTTHVVAGKRNTAKCLQALVNAKYIVDNTFLDHVVYAATPGDLDVPESLSKLEEDFDKHWPDANNYLPAPGKEPGQRPKELFKPDATRENIFEGYTFILFDQRQFESLQPPITNAGGKALFYEIQPEKTTATELVDYTRGIIDQHNSDESKVILVRFNGEKGCEDWANDMQKEVIVTLGRESIEQNEFLDAILVNDPTKLQRTLSGFGKRTSSTAQAAPSRSRPGGIDVAPAEPPQPAPGLRGRGRGPIKSAFSGFDDGFDPSQVTTFKRSARASSTGRKPLCQQAHEEQHPDVIMEEGSEDEAAASPRNPRKRPPPDDEDLLDEMLPATAALKRRKLEEQARARNHSSSPPPAVPNPQPKPSKKKPKEKELDILGELRSHKAQQEANANEDETSLRETLEGMTVSEMKRLAVVEIMPLRARSSAQTNASDTRWDPRWNGRKNFKKFRRQGEPGTARRGQTVIVPLLEVKKRGHGHGHGHGLGESYYIPEPSAGRRRKGAGRREVEFQAEERGEESESLSYPEGRGIRDEEVPAELQDGGETEVVDVDAPRATRGDRRGAAVGSKRLAEPVEKGRAKKQRIVRGESDSEDEMRFRFRKKR